MEKVEINSTQSMSTIHSFALNGCVCVCVSVHLFRFENLSFSRIWPPSQLVELTQIHKHYYSIRKHQNFYLARLRSLINFYRFLFASSCSCPISLSFALFRPLFSLSCCYFCYYCCYAFDYNCNSPCLDSVFFTCSRFVRNFNHRCDLVW